MSPSKFLKLLRGSFRGSRKVYMHGSCVQLFQMLRALFPNAVMYWSESERHCYTRIGKHYYDIRGKVKPPSDIKITTRAILMSWAVVKDVGMVKKRFPKGKII